MKTLVKKILISGVLFVGAFVPFAFAHASTDVWTGNGGNVNWSTAGNWSLSAAPGTGDVATFNSTCSSNCSPTINAAINVGGINIAGAAGNGGYYAAGTVGSYAGVFNGSNNYVGISYDLPRASSSVSFWVKTTANGVGISQWSANSYNYTSNTDRQFFIDSNGDLEFYVFGGGSCNNANYYLVSTSAVNDGNWHLVVATWSTTGKSLYIDGSLQASNATGIYTSGVSAMPYMSIGFGYASGCHTNPYDAQFMGYLDDFRVYTSVLQASDVSTLYAGGSVPSGLVGEWNFELNASDSSGSGHNGTFNGSGAGTVSSPTTVTVTQASGSNVTVGGSGFTLGGGSYYSTTAEVGTDAAFFDGGDNFVTLPRTIQDDLTICAWFNTTTAGNGTNHWQSMPLYDSEVNGAANDLGFGIDSNGHLMFGDDSGSSHFTVNGVTQVNTGVWQFGCATRVKSTGLMTLYVNGNVDNSATGGTVSLTSNPFARIGYGYDGGSPRYFNGYIDDVRVYTAALTQTQIQSIYTGSPPSSNLAGEWNFELSSSDSSGNGANGFWSGTPSAGAGTSVNFVGTNNAATTMTINGSYSQTGGSFTNAAGGLTTTGNVTMTGGVFIPNGGKLTFNHQGSSNETVTCTGSPFGIVSTIGSVTTDLTVAAGCLIHLGTNPSTVGGFINYGTITVDGGTWTNNTWLNGWGGNSQNYGTINASAATGWLWNGGNNSPDGLIQENSSSVVTYGGTSMTFTGDLNVALGTFPAGQNIVFNHEGSSNETVTCSGSPFGIVSTIGSVTTDLTVAAGCLIHLGTNPSTVGGFINYGTITVDGGTWTNNTWLNGWGGNSQNYGTINASAATGWLWNGGNNSPDGLIQENSSSVVTYGGTSMTFTGDLNVALGTFPAGQNIVFNHEGSSNETVTCSGSPFGIVSTIGSVTTDLTVAAGCLIHLGTNPSTVGGFINYGTITVDGGTWTNNTWLNGWGGNSQNYGTINASAATGWLWNGGNNSPDGLIQENSSSVVTYGGTSMTFTGDLNVALGTFPAGQNIVFNHEGSSNETVTCSGSPFGIVSTIGSVTTDLTVAAGCLIHLGTNPSTVGGFINYGTITVDGGTWTNNTWLNGWGGNSQNYGTINASAATGWLWNGGNNSPDGLIQENSSSVVTYGGTSMTFTGDLNIVLGSFPAGVNVTFYHEGASGETLTCTGSPLGIVSVTGSVTARLTIVAGCAIDLGTNPSTVGAFFNYGTITVDGGTWTNNTWNNSGWGGESENFGTISASGATGWLWNGGNNAPDGLIQENSSSVVTVSRGENLTFTGDLNLALGTFSPGANITIDHAGNDQTLTCDASNSFDTVTVNGSAKNLYFGTNNPCNFTGDLDIYAGTVVNPGSAFTTTVAGNYNQSNSGYTVGGANLTISMTGSVTSTINETSGTFSSNFNVNKTGIATVQLLGDFNVANGGTCTVNSGTFDIYSHNFTCSGALTVNSAGWLADYPGYTSTITLGGSVTNNGVIFLDGSGPVCTSPYPNFVVIQSSATGTQRAWSGSGETIIRYAKVKDQAGSTPITDYDGTNSGNNGGNWTFVAAAGRPELIQKTTAFTGTGALPGAMSAFSYRPRTGDTVLVAVSTYNKIALPPTDNAGDTYFLAASSTYGSPNTGLYLYYAENVTSTPSFTVTLNGTGGGGGVNSEISAVAYDFTGLTASGTILDNENTNVDTSGNAMTLSIGPATGYAGSDELYFALATGGASSTSLSYGSGWTGVDNIPVVSSYQPTLSTEYQSLSTISAQTATWSASASTTYGAMLAIFAPPGFQGSGYAASGTLDSLVTFDTQSTNGAQLNSITWGGTANNGTKVGFQIAVSNSSSGPWTYEGPSGDATTYFTGTAGTPIPLVSSIGGPGYSLFSGYRYFRYRTILFSDIARIYTPVVSGVNVNWSP